MKSIGLWGATVTAEEIINVEVAMKVEDNIKKIMSSPSTSSNPYDYIKAHPIEYQTILKEGEEALKYLLSEFKNGDNSGLRGYIMMVLCKELLGDRNNISDESLSPQEWYKALVIRKEVELPDFVCESNDSIEKLVYKTEVEQHYHSNKDGFIIVAPKIFGSYEEGNKLKVFVTTYSTTYKLYENILSEQGGSIVPATIIYTKTADGNYSLEEYKQAKDGSGFSESIKEYCTMPVSGEKIDGLADKILNHYGNYDDIITLERENLIKHLKSNNQTGIKLKSVTGEIIPLT